MYVSVQGRVSARGGAHVRFAADHLAPGAATAPATGGFVGGLTKVGWVGRTTGGFLVAEQDANYDGGLKVKEGTCRRVEAKEV